MWKFWIYISICQYWFVLRLHIHSLFRQGLRYHLATIPAILGPLPTTNFFFLKTDFRHSILALNLAFSTDISRCEQSSYQ